MSDTGSADSAPGQTVIVAVTGGIAAYKTATLVSRLAQAGQDTRVIMTEAATRFVTPLTLATLSGHAVHTSLWEQTEARDSQHIALARSAKLLILAPASANTIAKIAHGLCDNLVSTVACALPATTARLFAPAMNADMWANPIVQRNVATLVHELAYQQVGPDAGWQACRTLGAGRMAEAESILQCAETILAGTSG